MIRQLRLTAAIVLLAVMSACASLGMQSPDTFNKRVAAAYTTVQTIADSAVAAYSAGKLSKSDATNVVVTARAALTAIDLADGLHTTDPTGGEDKLTATLSILTALQAYIATQGAKP